MIIELLLIIAAVSILQQFWLRRRKLPPGPMPLPLVGNMLSILKEPPGEAVFSRWRRQYGDVYTYWMGSLPIVAVNDFTIINETFIKDGESYAGRWIFEDWDAMIKGGNYGVIFTEGDIWREQRRFALRILRDFGLGKNVMQQRVLEEVETLIQKVGRDISNGVKEHGLVDHVDLGVGSIINAVMFGYRFVGEREEQFFELKKLMAAHVNVLGNPLVFMMMPNPHAYKNLPIMKEKLAIVKQTADDIFEFLCTQIREHEENLQMDVEPNDFVYAFLQELHHRNENKETHYFSIKQLRSLCYDLWLAGQETTSNTIGWGLAYLVHNPEVQRKAWEELDRVIGSDRLITNADKPDLPYCNAVVYEVQRIANLLPQNVWHKTTRPVKINGYDIPTGTAIIPQLSVILTDEKIYPDHKKFKPERFIDENGRLKKAEELIPFSVGKRMCLGEGLARMELFLFIINIVNQFELIPGDEKPNLKRKFGGTVHPEYFKCEIKKRATI